MPKMKAYASFELFYQDQSPVHRRIIDQLDVLVLKTAPALNKSVKWSNGVWLSGDTPVLYAHCEPDHVQFGFFGGSGLGDPGKVLVGSGKYVRHVKIYSPEDIDEATLSPLISQASART